MLVHNVFFALNDDSEAAKLKLLADCRKYLVKHPGVVFFACGTVQDELARPVNLRDFDVALHVVFDSLASHDLYQEAADHLKFIELNNPNWKTVRVFDSNVSAS